MLKIPILEKLSIQGKTQLAELSPGIEINIDRAGKGILLE